MIYFVNLDLLVQCLPPECTLSVLLNAVFVGFTSPFSSHQSIKGVSSPCSSPLFEYNLVLAMTSSKLSLSISFALVTTLSAYFTTCHLLHPAIDSNVSVQSSTALLCTGCFFIANEKDVSSNFVGKSVCVRNRLNSLPFFLSMLFRTTTGGWQLLAWRAPSNTIFHPKMLFCQTFPFS